jgi:hypothetical protein
VNGQIGQDLFTGNTTLVNGSLAWSPVSDEFLYYSILSYPHGIYRGIKGSDVSTHSLVMETDYVSGLNWIPDGSGFLFSTENFGYFSNQIIKFDFSSHQATVLAEGSIYLVGVEVSPDGLYFAYADRADENSPYDLFGKAIDGSQQWNIANDVVSWDWGPEMSTGVIESFGDVKNFELLPNYPNPFDPSTNIHYSLPITAHVTLKIFDLLGHEIATLAHETHDAGSYMVTFDARQVMPQLASGVYCYELIADTNGSALFSATRKMVLGW